MDNSLHAKDEAGSMTWQTAIALTALAESAVLLFFVLPSWITGGWARVRGNARLFGLLAVGLASFPILSFWLGSTIELAFALLLLIGGWAYSRVERRRESPELQRRRAQALRSRGALLRALTIGLLAYIVVGTWIITALTR
jgi:membrane protein implicated in regulation of membrane protease activity